MRPELKPLARITAGITMRFLSCRTAIVSALQIAKENMEVLKIGDMLVMDRNSKLSKETQN